MSIATDLLLARKDLVEFQERNKELIDLWIGMLQHHKMETGNKLPDGNYEKIVMAEYFQKVEQVERLTRMANREYLSTVEITRTPKFLANRPRANSRMHRELV